MTPRSTSVVQAIVWKDEHLELLDQRKLPFEVTYLPLKRPGEVAAAIRDMVVRGAPAIGVTAAYGLVLALLEQEDAAHFENACETLLAARPTAVNLSDAVQTMRAGLAGEYRADRALQLARRYHQDDLAKCKAMGKHGAAILNGRRRVLTHCNAGALATAGWGTALGVVRQLFEEGRLEAVYADETRPFLQGARLTSWELQQDGIPVKLVTDGMGGYLMSNQLVDCVVVGSDRIAANGDVANKIGTSMLAFAARWYGIPFIVAAPTTTVDSRTPTGKEIPIELRPPEEITHVRGQPITDAQTQVFNPAFDVTPAELVTAIVTEDGVHRYPFDFR